MSIEMLGHKPEQLVFTLGNECMLQGGMIERGLQKLGVQEQVQVQTGIEFRDSAEFSDTRTFALTSFNEISIALALSERDMTQEQREQMKVLIVPSGYRTKGISEDRDTGTIWTSGFWMAENGVFKRIQVSSPIPIDGVLDIFTPVEGEVAKKYTAKDDQVDLASEDKIRTKEIFAADGVAVPKGVGIRSGDRNALWKFYSFMFQNPDIEWLVGKENSTSMGEGIFMVHGDEEVPLELFGTMVYDYAEGNHGKDLVVEERVLPYQHPNIGVLKEILGTENDVDYNFRVLVTTDAQDPQVIDAEIRMREFGDDPVNISVDAKAARLDVLQDSELNERIYEASRNAVRALVRHELGENGSTVGYMGTDVILDKEGMPIVLEVNGSQSGGLGTLTRLDGRIPKSIGHVYLPHVIPQLEEKFRSRQACPEWLLQVPSTPEDRIGCLNQYISNEDWQGTYDVMLDIMPEFDGDTDWFINMMRFLEVKLGKEHAMFAFDKKENWMKVALALSVGGDI